MSAPPSPPRRPWMGLASYSADESELFFGRDDETHDLVALVERDRLGVLFGPSGVGKTSLLRAGLFPVLARRKFLPIHVRLAHDEHGRDLDDQVWAQLTAAAQQAGLHEPPGSIHPDEGLWEHFHRHGHRF